MWWLSLVEGFFLFRKYFRALLCLSEIENWSYDNGLREVPIVIFCIVIIII
jgi:hypothetical protein